jgi:hypothetical protein
MAKRLLQFRRLPVQVALFELTLDFFSNDWHFGGGFDADADDAGRNANNRHGDIVADQDFFTDFSRENQHKGPPRVFLGSGKPITPIGRKKPTITIAALAPCGKHPAKKDGNRPLVAGVRHVKQDGPGADHKTGCIGEDASGFAASESDIYR